MTSLLQYLLKPEYVLIQHNVMASGKVRTFAAAVEEAIAGL